MKKELTWLDRWALKRAAKIKPVVEKVQKKKADDWQKNYAIRQQLVIESRKMIHVGLQPIIEKLEKTPCHIKVGDRAIMNVYELNYQGIGVWDGGARTYTRNATEAGFPGPHYVTITDIRIDTSYTDDKIDKWIANLDEKVLKDLLTSGNTFAAFSRWFHNYGSTINIFYYPDTLGVYKNAFFDVGECTFKPKWGLCVANFLKDDSESGKLTAAIVTEETEIDEKTKKLYEMKAALDARKREIEETYKGIKYIR